MYFFLLEKKSIFKDSKGGRFYFKFLKTEKMSLDHAYNGELKLYQKLAAIS